MWISTTPGRVLSPHCETGSWRLTSDAIQRPLDWVAETVDFPPMEEELTVRLTMPQDLAVRCQVGPSLSCSKLTQMAMVPVEGPPARAPDGVPNRRECSVARPSLSSVGQTLNEISISHFPRYRPFLGRETRCGKRWVSHGAHDTGPTRYGCLAPSARGTVTRRHTHTQPQNTHTQHPEERVSRATLTKRCVVGIHVQRGPIGRCGRQW